MRRSRREEEDRRVISISLHAAEGLLNLGMDRNRHPEMGKACVCVCGGGCQEDGTREEVVL